MPGPGRVRAPGELSEQVIMIIGATKEDIQKDDLAREPIPREARCQPSFANHVREN